MTCVLTTLVCVEYFRPGTFQSTIQRRNAELCIERNRQVPTQHVPTVPVHHCRQVDESSSQSNVRNVAAPNVIWLVDTQTSQKVGIFLMLLVFKAQTLLRIDRLKTQQPHQPPYTITTCRLILLLKVVTHPSRPPKRMTGVLFVDQPHVEQITLAQRLRLVIVTRTPNTQQFTLSSNRRPRGTRFDQLSPVVTTLQLFFSASPARIGAGRSAGIVSPRAAHPP